MEDELIRLRAENAALRAKNAELESEIVAISDSYNNELYEVRGRLRGVLSGNIKRWIVNALECGNASPPRITPLKERLEECLKLIEKESARFE
jgi:hypothetical protein